MRIKSSDQFSGEKTGKLEKLSIMDKLFMGEFPEKEKNSNNEGHGPGLSLLLGYHLEKPELM